MIKILTLGTVAMQSIAPVAHIETHNSEADRDKRSSSGITYNDIYNLKRDAATHIFSSLPLQVSQAVSRYTVEGWLNRIPDAKWRNWITDMNSGLSRDHIYSLIKQTVMSGAYGSEGQWYMQLNDQLQDADNRINTLKMIRDMTTDSAARSRLNTYISMLESKRYNLIHGPAWNWQNLNELNNLANSIQGIDQNIFDQLMVMNLNGSMNWNYGQVQSLIDTLVRSRDFVKLFGKDAGALTKLQQIFMFVVSGVLAIMSALMAWLFMRNRKIKSSKGIKVFIASTGSVFLTVAASLLVIALI